MRTVSKSPSLPYRPEDKGPDKSLVRAFRKVEEACHGHNVYERNVNAHWPVDISLLPMVCNEAGNIAPHFQGEIHCKVVIGV